MSATSLGELRHSQGYAIQEVLYEYAKLRQDHLSGALKKEERALPTPAERRALAGLTSERARIAFLASALRRRARDGSPVGRIRIPRIGISFVVVNGTSTSALESGPGIYPATAFPGLGGTTAIAGHRTTYLAPFAHIEQLRRGDPIWIQTPYATFEYRIVRHVIVPSDAMYVLRTHGQELSDQTEHEQEKMSDAPLAPGLANAVQELISLGSQIGSAIDDLRVHREHRAAGRAVDLRDSRPLHEVQRRDAAERQHVHAADSHARAVVLQARLVVD